MLVNIFARYSYLTKFSGILSGLVITGVIPVGTLPLAASFLLAGNEPLVMRLLKRLILDHIEMMNTSWFLGKCFDTPYQKLTAGLY